MTDEQRKMNFLELPRPKKVINTLREKYPGKWIYTGDTWVKDDGGYACYVAILGGFNGDDLVGSELFYYPATGTPERVY